MGYNRTGLWPTLTITRRALEAKRACPDGMRFFDELRKAQGRKHSVKIELSPVAQLWLLRACPYARWLLDIGLLPSMSAPEADLRGVDLSMRDLSRANFRGARLGGADFQGANLTGATFTWADLRGVDFRGTLLCRANFNNAVVRGADFRYANLDGATHTAAQLRGKGALVDE